MKINTSRFGEIDVDESKIITFDNGLLGFEEVKEYILLADGSGFYWLQALNRGELALACMDPKKVCDNYAPEVDESVIDALEIKNDDDALILCIVVIPEDIKKTTVNLKAPVIINNINNKAVQIVLENNNYAIRHQVFAQ